MAERIALLLMLLLPGWSSAAQAGELSATELEQIAGLIFKNECASKNACLTSWNDGEEFASLGIGHFIWYPAGSKKTFRESFPALIAFMQEQGAALPGWLAANPQHPNPWQNRETFLAAIHSAAMSELRALLINTKALQARFMLQRFRAALPQMLESVASEQREHITQQFERVAASPMGLYALIDYVNFKGEGSNPEERYRGKGWGLLQVLENMSAAGPGIEAIRAFSDSAERMLTRRVELSPAERNEARWLPGWRKRLTSYIRESERLLEQGGM